MGSIDIPVGESAIWRIQLITVPHSKLNEKARPETSGRALKISKSHSNYLASITLRVKLKPVASILKR